MDISIRRAAGIVALAYLTLASTAAAQIGETGKLRLTGGVNTIDGVAGGAMAPEHRRLIWRAVIGETNGTTVDRRDRSVLHRATFL